MTDPRYPIGRFAPPSEFTTESRAAALAAISACPDEVRRATRGLSAEQLDTPYRDGGWTVRQVVHHLPDSHMNAYVRHKLAVTEESPTIRPYREELWAELPEAKSAAIELSTVLLTALHTRWALFLRALPEAAFARTLVHPDSGPMALDRSLALYAWHGRHHVAQIDALRDRRGW